MCVYVLYAPRQIARVYCFKRSDLLASSTSPPLQLLLFVHPTLARSRSHDKKERGRSAREGLTGRNDGGQEGGEGLINGWRHAPENIAGREGAEKAAKRPEGDRDGGER